MEEEEIEKAVIAYLKKKGFKQTELALQEEQNKNPSTSHTDPDVAKRILSFSESENGPARYQEGYSKLRSWTHSSLDLYKMASNRPTMPLFDEAKEVQAVWTSEQEYYFIDLMFQKVQAKGGNRQIGTFSKKEWLDMRVNFYNKFQKKYSLKQFKNKVTHLKDRYNVFKKLMEGSTTTVLGWDPVLKTVTASDEWWDNYLKTNPKARRFRHQGCPEYEQLGVIFGDTVATGILQASVDHDFNSTDGENNEDEEFAETIPSTPLEGASAPSTGVDGEGRNMEGPSRPRSRTPTSSIRRGRKDSKSSKLSDALHRIAEVGQRRIERKDKYTLSECMVILDAFGSELCESTYMRALKLLQEKGWREAFIHMTDERRKGWLRSVKSRDI